MNCRREDEKAPLRVIVPYPCCGPDQPTTQNSFQVLWQVFILGGSVQQTKQTCQQERERECVILVFYFTAFVEERSQSPMIWESNKVVVSKILYVHPYVGTSSNLTCAYFSGWVRSTTNRTISYISCYFCKEGQTPEMTSEKKRRCLDRCPFFVGSLGIPIVICPGKKKKTPFGRKNVSFETANFGTRYGWVGEKTLESIWMFFCCETLKRRAVCFLLLPSLKLAVLPFENRPKPNRKRSIPSIPFLGPAMDFFSVSGRVNSSQVAFCARPEGLTPLKMGGGFLGYRSSFFS